MNTGWEVRPLGWLLITLLIGVVLYNTLIKRTNPSSDDPQTHLTFLQLVSYLLAFAIAALYSMFISVLLRFMIE